MASPDEKTQDMVARREIVVELSKLGLVAASVSESLGISITEVENAVQGITGTYDSAQNSVFTDAVYSRAFSVYASAVVAAVSPPSVGLRGALERYLDVPNVIAIAEGVIAGAEVRENRETSPTLTPYQNLIHAIWGAPRGPNLTGTTLLEVLCHNVAEGSVQSPTHSGMARALGAALVAEEPFVPMLPLTEFAARHIDDILKTSLSPAQHIVIDKRFGLTDQHVHTLTECGKFIDRSQESARQHEAKALRKLRHPKTLNKFSHLFSWGTSREHITNLLTLA